MSPKFAGRQELKDLFNTIFFDCNSGESEKSALFYEMEPIFFCASKLYGPSICYGILTGWRVVR